MEIIATVALSACISWLIADIKCKLHLRQIDQTLDEYMENLKEVHDEYFEKLYWKGVTRGRRIQTNIDND